MAHTLVIPPTNSKEEKYQVLLPQLKSLVEVETDFIANLSNLAAALKFGMGFFWVGFYLVKEMKASEELVLGPFQGPVACTRIKKGKGVCGKSWDLNQIILVEDVDKFEGHIACSSDAKSEIVLPARNKNGKVALILDVDSDKVADFDAVDSFFLNEVIQLIETLIVE